MIARSDCAIGFAGKKFFSRSHDNVIRVYDAAGNVIETLCSELTLSCKRRSEVEPAAFNFGDKLGLV